MTNLESRRDLIFPFALNLIRRRKVLLKIYSDQSSENARRAWRRRLEFVESKRNDKRALIVREDQHEYIFTEAL